ncbi:hypothetical protein WA158_006193 [Blastocystis sp. Blastoise]
MDSNESVTITNIKQDPNLSQFLSPTFVPEKYTSDTIESLKTKEGEGDLDASSKLLGSYLDDIKTDLQEIVSVNKSELYSELNSLAETKKDFGVIRSKVTDITKRFKLLKCEIDGPYQNIQNQAKLLSRYQDAGKLLRQITSFRFGVKKIRSYLQDNNPNTKIWLKTSRAYLDTINLLPNQDLYKIDILKEDLEWMNQLKIEIDSLS